MEKVRSIPSSWQDIIDWCTEATDLSILISDVHTTTTTTKHANHNNNNHNNKTMFQSFTPFVHRTLLKPTSFASVYVGTSKQVRLGALGTNACRTTDLNDFPSPLFRWSFPFRFRNKVIVVVETIQTTITESEESPSATSSPSPPNTTTTTTTNTKNNPRYFVSLSQFTNILAHLQRLQSLLLTGSHVTTSPDSIAAYGNTTNDDDGDLKLCATATTTTTTTTTQHTSSQQQQQQQHYYYNNYSNPDTECGICMDAISDVVLPCLHRFCTTCAATWIEAHAHCPLCRRAMSWPEAEREQWQLTTWSTDDLTRHVRDVEQKLGELCTDLMSANNNDTDTTDDTSLKSSSSSRRKMSFHKLYIDFLHLD